MNTEFRKQLLYIRESMADCCTGLWIEGKYNRKSGYCYNRFDCKNRDNCHLYLSYLDKCEQKILYNEM